MCVDLCVCKVAELISILYGPNIVGVAYLINSSLLTVLGGFPSHLVTCTGDHTQPFD